MPLNNPAPNFGLLTSWDVRGYSGTQLFTRSGGGAVSLPTYSAGEGVYDDVLFFLNGRGSSSSLKAQGQLAYGASVGGVGTTWAATITADDKVQFSSDVDFTLTKTGTSDPLGFGSSTLSATLVGSDYVITAPNDWTRGLLDLSDALYRIDEVSSSDTFNFPLLLSDIQDVSVFIRGHSEGDADDFGLTSLQELDNTAQSRTDITWTITDDGHTRCYYPTSKGDVDWTSTAMRDALGFTGDETPVVDGSFSRVTSTHKNTGVLIPSRPYQSHHLSVEQVSQSRRKIGGGYVANHIGSYISSQLTFDLDALLDAVDDYRHFTNKFLPLVSEGERINFYQSWGDSRRALITADVNTSQPAYDLLYSSEHNGAYGRIRGSMRTATYDLSYPTRLQRRVPVSVEIEHL
mgnify:CR=1 FL=1|jgi:hypothetical protein